MRGSELITFRFVIPTMHQRARNLRRSMTDAERKLWQYLRARHLCGFKFRRQYPVASYIADFVCLERMLVVEVDGSQHQEQENYDNDRTQGLNRMGFRVLRFWNNDVLNRIDSVLEAILLELE